MADELQAEPLLAAGYPTPRAHITQDTVKTDARSTVSRYDHTDSAALWHKRVCASADPVSPTNVHLRCTAAQPTIRPAVRRRLANPAREGYLTVRV